MIPLALSLLALFALSIVYADHPSCCGAGKYDSFPPAQVNFTSDTVLEVNNGWQPFFFGGAGTWGLASNVSGAFYTAFPFPIVLRVTDAFQTGDRFAVYLNETFLGNTTLPVYNSTTYTPYPNEAWLQVNYTHGEWIIPSGLQRYTIEVLDSVNPSGSGAFIRADINPAVVCGDCRKHCASGPCKCFPVVDPKNPPGCCANNPKKVYPICKEATGQFYMIKGQFSRDQAIEACSQMNLRLAEITSANFEGVNQFGYSCNENQVARSWIRSWNGDSYEGACLVLSSGSFSGAGAINVFPCETKNFALCEA